MDRAQVLALIDVANARGLEIGALNRPVVTREMGPVEYVDRASRAELQAWYAVNDQVNVDDIDVDGSASPLAPRQSVTPGAGGQGGSPIMTALRLLASGQPPQAKPVVAPPQPTRTWTTVPADAPIVPTTLAPIPPLPPVPPLANANMACTIW